MNLGVINAGFWLADAVGVGRLLGRRSQDRLTILCYHSIVDRPLPERVSRAGLHLQLDVFARQATYLADHCEVIPLSEALERPRRGRGRPRVALTFDDGYANNARLAFPILSRLGLPATLFVVPSFASKPRLPWWDEINWLLTTPPTAAFEWGPLGTLDFRLGASDSAFRRAREFCMGAMPDERAQLLDRLAQAAGARDESIAELLRPSSWEELARLPDVIRIGNHTHTHRVIDRINRVAIEWEIASGRAELLRHLGSRQTEPNLLCYPRGVSTAEARTVAAGLGVQWGLGLLDGVGHRPTAGADSNRLNLPRMIVGPQLSDRRFRFATVGFYPVRRVPPASG